MQIALDKLMSNVPSVFAKNLDISYYGARSMVCFGARVIVKTNKKYNGVLQPSQRTNVLLNSTSRDAPYMSTLMTSVLTSYNFTTSVSVIAAIVV